MDMPPLTVPVPEPRFAARRRLMRLRKPDQEQFGFIPLIANQTTGVSDPFFNKYPGKGIKRRGFRSSSYELNRGVSRRESSWGGNMADAGAKKSGSMFASQRKNVEAILRANQLAFDGVQAVWLRQLDFIREAAEEFTTHVGDLAPPSRPLNEKFAKEADYSKRAFEKNLANAHELTEIATKATSDATNIINQRFCEGLDEVPSPGKAER